MRKNIYLGAACVVLAACGAGGTGGESASTATDGNESTSNAAEVATVEASLIDFFLAMDDGVRSGDFAALELAVTSDFELIEDTLVLNMPEFIDYLQPFVDGGASMTRELSDFNTEVRGSVAWTRYRNRGVLTMGGQATNFEWLESVVLVKTAAGWKVDRLQSNPVRSE